MTPHILWMSFPGSMPWAINLSLCYQKNTKKEHTYMMYRHKRTHYVCSFFEHFLDHVSISELMFGRACPRCLPFERSFLTPTLFFWTASWIHVYMSIALCCTADLRTSTRSYVPRSTRRTSSWRRPPTRTTHRRSPTFRRSILFSKCVGRLLINFEVHL